MIYNQLRNLSIFRLAPTLTIFLFSLSTSAFAQNSNQSIQVQSNLPDLEKTEKLVTVINSAEKVQVQYFLPRYDPNCVIDFSSVSGTKRCPKGLLTIVFSGMVTNPVLHLASGTSFITGNSWAVINGYRLITPNTSMVLPNTSTYMSMTTFMGQPQLTTTALRASAGVIQPTCVMTINIDQFCDDVQVNGNYSILTFEVDRIAVPVLADSGPTQTMPAPP